MNCAAVILNSPAKIGQLATPFRQPGGAVDYQALLMCPRVDRLPGLVQRFGRAKVVKILSALVTHVSTSMNLIRNMNDMQIVDCVEELINTAHEDNLGLEDLAVFFDGFLKGQYIRIVDRLDQQVIFTALEVFRQARHEMYFAVKDQQHRQYSTAGRDISIPQIMREGLSPEDAAAHDAKLQEFTKKYGNEQQD